MDMESSSDATSDKDESLTFAAQEKLTIEQKSALKEKHLRNSAMIKELKRNLQRTAVEEADIERKYKLRYHQYAEKTSMLNEMLKVLEKKEETYDMLLEKYLKIDDVVNDTFAKDIKEIGKCFTIKEIKKLLTLDFNELLAIEELNKQFEDGMILDDKIKDWLKQVDDFPMAAEASAGTDEDKEGEVAENADGNEHDDPSFEISKA